MALKASINGETHFEDFITHIENNQDVMATQNPYTTEQILSIAYTLVFRLGVYPF